MPARQFLIAFTFLASAPAEVRPAPRAAFIPNRGQAESSVQYMVKSADLSAHFRPSGVVFRSRDMNVRLHFLGGRAQTIEAADRLPGVANFLIGNEPRKWKRKIPTFGSIVYKELYPGIDARYSSAEVRLKSEFLVHPGADPGAIRFVYEGASEARVDASGALILRTESGELREEPPVAFQDTGEGRASVTATYSLGQDGSIGFDLGDYDRTVPLVIDPTITYSTYLGGSGMDTGTSIAVDTAGNTYVAGWTESLDFPKAGQGRARVGSVDAFVAKLAPGGASLIYTTYLGGSGDDRAMGIAVDSTGRAAVTGYTTSYNFPQAYPTGARSGGKDVFVTKLDPSGSRWYSVHTWAGRAPMPAMRSQWIRRVTSSSPVKPVRDSRR